MVDNSIVTPQDITDILSKIEENENVTALQVIHMLAILPVIKRKASDKISVYVYDKHMHILCTYSLGILDLGVGTNSINIHVGSDVFKSEELSEGNVGQLQWYSQYINKYMELSEIKRLLL